LRPSLLTRSLQGGRPQPSCPAPRLARGTPLLWIQFPEVSLFHPSRATKLSPFLRLSHPSPAAKFSLFLFPVTSLAADLFSFLPRARPQSFLFFFIPASLLAAELPLRFTQARPDGSFLFCTPRPDCGAFSFVYPPARPPKSFFFPATRAQACGRGVLAPPAPPRGPFSRACYPTPARPRGARFGYYLP